MNSTNATFKFHAIAEPSAKTTLIDPKQHLSPPTTHLTTTNLHYGGLLLVTVGFGVAVILFIFKYSRFGKWILQEPPNRSSCHKIPCRSCRYFVNNYYLNCAVHPSRALTDQAIACPDYCPGKAPPEMDHSPFV